VARTHRRESHLALVIERGGGDLVRLKRVGRPVAGGGGGRGARCGGDRRRPAQCCDGKPPGQSPPTAPAVVGAAHASLLSRGAGAADVCVVPPESTPFAPPVEETPRGSIRLHRGTRSAHSKSPTPRAPRPRPGVRDAPRGGATARSSRRRCAVTNTEVARRSFHRLRVKPRRAGSTPGRGRSPTAAGRSPAHPRVRGRAPRTPSSPLLLAPFAPQAS